MHELCPGNCFDNHDDDFQSLTFQVNVSQPATDLSQRKGWRTQTIVGRWSHPFAFTSMDRFGRGIRCTSRKVRDARFFGDEPFVFCCVQQWTVFQFENRPAERLFSAGGWLVPRTRAGRGFCIGSGIKRLMTLAFLTSRLASPTLAESPYFPICFKHGAN